MIGPPGTSEQPLGVSQVRLSLPSGSGSPGSKPAPFSASNATTHTYTWGVDLSGTIHGAGDIGALLAVEETQGTYQGTYWFFYDGNGNVGQVIKASDPSIAARYEYGPYGNIIGPDDDADGDWREHATAFALANPIRFPTKWFDPETPLGYWGYRYYSPRLGRWMSRDPIGERGGANLYEFVGNGPDNRIDPHGLVSEPLYGPPLEFWKWLHHEQGGKLIESLKMCGVVPEDIAREYYEEWLANGSPSPVTRTPRRCKPSHCGGPGAGSMGALCCAAAVIVLTNPSTCYAPEIPRYDAEYDHLCQQCKYRCRCYYGAVTRLTSWLIPLFGEEFAYTGNWKMFDGIVSGAECRAMQSDSGWYAVAAPFGYSMALRETVDCFLSKPD